MAKPASKTRQFSVHARHVDRHYARVVQETSFEAAAVAYVETFHPPMTTDRTMRIMVRDVTSGHEHCFVIDQESGEATACV